MICNEITPCENGGWRSVQCNRSFLTYHSSEIVFLGVVHGLEVSVLSITISSRSSSPPRGGGGTHKIIGKWWAARFPKPLPYIWPKSAIFPILFMIWPKIWNPIYDLLFRSLGEGLLLLALSTKTLNLRKGQRKKQRSRILVDLISKIWDTRNWKTEKLIGWIELHVLYFLKFLLYSVYRNIVRKDGILAGNQM